MRWLLLEKAKAHTMVETEVMTVTELELKNSSVGTEERGTAPGASRVEQNLPRNLAESISQKSRRGPSRKKLTRKHKASISTGVRLRNKTIPKRLSPASSKTSI